LTNNIPMDILCISMSYAVVNTKVDPQTKKEAMETANALGIPLSIVIKAFLKQFIRTKSISFSAESEEPTEYMLKSLKLSEAEEKAGKVISFKSGKDALDYVDSLIKDENKKKRAKR
jgi:addiction module RelB/DinJ family antitoxin